MDLFLLEYDMMHFRPTGLRVNLMRSARNKRKRCLTFLVRVVFGCFSLYYYCYYYYNFAFLWHFALLREPGNKSPGACFMYIASIWHKEDKHQ